MSKEKEEIVQAGIKLEEGGRAFYLKAASGTPNELARKMFESLAEDELRHVEWLKELSSRGRTALDANRELYGRLRGVFAEAPGDVKGVEDDIEAIDVAVCMEEKSEAAYKEWGAGSDSEEVRSLCKTIAAQETFHRQLLENTKEYFRRPGDWFMQEEQWNFEGG